MPGNLAASLIQLITLDERSLTKGPFELSRTRAGPLLTPEFLAILKEWTAERIQRRGEEGNNPCCFAYSILRANSLTLFESCRSCRVVQTLRFRRKQS